MQGSGDEATGSCVGKSGGSVAVRGSGGGSSSQGGKRSDGIAGRSVVAVAAVPTILQATVGAIEAVVTLVSLEAVSVTTGATLS